MNLILPIPDCPATVLLLLLSWCSVCSGYGYGAGIRIDSPLGPVRLEYAWNEQRSGRFHVALGYD
jgi:outer membrane protein assembly factor BamA